MRKFIFFFVSAVLAFAGVSCQNSADEPKATEAPATPEVNIQFALDSSNVGVTNTDFRYTAFVYDADSNMPVDTIRSGKSLLCTRLKKGNYRLVAWADYSPIGVNNDFYFLTGDASKLSLLGGANYAGDDSQKMAFFGSCNFKVEDNSTTVSATLAPQMGQYRLYASDTPSYSVGQIKVSYPKGLPSSVNPEQQTQFDTLTGVSYTAKTQADLITFDNIFVNGDEIKVTVYIEVFDTNGKLKSKKEFLVPVVKGAVKSYSAEIYTNSGITIDDGFDQEFFIDLDKR